MTYGVCFTQGEDDYHSFPLDEDAYDVNPMDTYACSKLCGVSAMPAPSPAASAWTSTLSVSEM